eukprot:CAMPEP_0118956744 /NCGR_PEP_ID=MMETSP1169-20130426/61741_1 /TAXON_ID=36882 /ORGANISM="Pyramimonas obovata, Strain CCMP722" /LENGTH=138 /DNA_ID=CAMNT_0006904791 /DNA_START=571 /DNA_END=987 /DNA_ORIENTATION=-
MTTMRVSLASPAGLSGSRVVSRAARVQPAIKRATVCTANKPTTSAPPAPATETTSTMTVEQQRQAAKDLVKYFNDKQYEADTLAQRVFGWVPNAEISNGRWVMFGLMVGLMTEYATGVTFIDQIKLTITNLGFADIYE